jgi:nitrogenase molybdenum-iron protein alpha chain
LVFHHDPVYDSGDVREDSLGHLTENYGDVQHFQVSNRQQYQLYGFLQQVKPDFLLIRHNGLAPLASRLGIPAAPLGDEHIAIGYQGIINLGESILDILAHKKFHDDIKKHVKLPYKKWWLDQKDPYVLARHPELIDD